MAEIKTDENSSTALDQDQIDDISCNFSSPTMWQDLGGSSLIQWT